MTPLIFDWAKQTPDRTAVIYNGQAWSYRSFANAIAVARGYFARRGYVGPGYAARSATTYAAFAFSAWRCAVWGLTTVDLRPAGAARGLQLFSIDRFCSLDDDMRFRALPRNELGKVLRQEVRAKAIASQSKSTRLNEPQFVSEVPPDNRTGTAA